MPQMVNTGSTTQCSFGAAPSTFVALPTNKVMAGNMPAGNIMDNKPFVNIPPFGMCMSLSNPTVAAATSAALGVLTPMPCIPVTAAPWTPGATKSMIGNMPALTNTSKCMCNWGGVISIVASTAVTQNAS